MKTPEKIKEGLECCQLHEGDMYVDCSHCPYYLTCTHCDIEMHKDAIAYIEQLEAQVPKWISVDDRLPIEGEDVLMMTSYGVSMGYYEPCRCYWHDYTNVEMDYVTHWMPLPEAPKEDANEDHD